MKNYWNSYLKKRVEGAQQPNSADAPQSKSTDSDVRGSPNPSENSQERITRPVNSDSSEPVESSSADDSSCLTEPGAAAVRPHAPVLPKVMFADWLDMDYGTGLMMTPSLEAGGAFDVSGRSPAQGSSVDSLHGLGDGGICWGFDEMADQMHMQGGVGGFSDLLSMSEFLGIN